MSALDRPGAYVGRSVPRVNDEVLLSGGGSFVDDLHLAGMVHAFVVRSQIAHGVVRSLDVASAREVDGVVDIITPADADDLRPIQCVRRMPDQLITSHPALEPTVRYVGQPIAVVVAESRAIAEDAAELLDIEVEPLPVVADPSAALAPDAPLLYPDLGTNVIASIAVGDGRAELDAIFDRAPHIVRRTLRIQRLAPSPLEPRGLVANWDDLTGQLTVAWSSQTPHHVRDGVAECLGLPASAVRVVVRGVGGGFGAKEHLYADEVLVCLAAQRCKRPVKWIEDRLESFVATLHARDQIWDARLALDDDGRFIAIDADVVTNLGAHPSTLGLGPAYAGQRMLEGPYRFERAGSRSVGVVTCTTPTGAYRGFGMQESTWVRERLVDEAARELGVDPVELRLRNMPGPEALPFRTRSGQEYDSGDYPTALRTAISSIEPPAPSNDRVRHGVGVASYVEMTGLAPSRVLALGGFDVHGYETAQIRVERDGSVVVITGTCPHGQGLETTLAQLAADHIGVPIERVGVVFGDTAIAPYSATGTIASRSMTVGGAAVVRCAELVRDQVRELGAHLLEANPADVEVVDGRVQVAGVPDRGIDIGDVARAAWRGADLPPGADAGLEAKVVHEPEGTAYSYATHAATVSVDLDTGEVTLEDYVVVHDCGVIVNPMIVDGQVHGGVAQGIGNALHEEMAYNDDGQPLSTTFLDYVLPGSGEVPEIRIEHMETPAAAVPGGMKGMGEGGTIGPPPTIANAIAAAVPEIADRLVATPLSPTVVWALLRDVGLA